jgi:hypothetical protein
MAFRTGWGRIWSKITGIAVRNVIVARPGEPSNLVRRNLFGFGPIAADGFGYPGGAVASSGSGRRQVTAGGPKRQELTPDEKTTANLNDVANIFRRALESYEKNKDSRNVGWMLFAVGVLFLAGLGVTHQLFYWVGKSFGLNLLALVFTLVGFVKASSSRPNLLPVVNSSERFLLTIFMMVEKPKDSNGNPLNPPAILEIVLGNKDTRSNLLALLLNAPETQKALANHLGKYIQEVAAMPAGMDKATVTAGLVTGIKEIIKGVRQAEADVAAKEKARLEQEQQMKEQAEADKKAAQANRSAAMKDSGAAKKK